MGQITWVPRFCNIWTYFTLVVFIAEGFLLFWAGEKIDVMAIGVEPNVQLMTYDWQKHTYTEI